jgi:hypothetical protein
MFWVGREEGLLEPLSPRRRRIEGELFVMVDQELRRVALITCKTFCACGTLHVREVRQSIEVASELSAQHF